MPTVYLPNLGSSRLASAAAEVSPFAAGAPLPLTGSLVESVALFPLFPHYFVFMERGTVRGGSGVPLKVFAGPWREGLLVCLILISLILGLHGILQSAFPHNRLADALGFHDL